MHIYYPNGKWLAKINRFQRLAAGYAASQASSLVVQFTVGAGGGAPSNGDTEYYNPSVVSGVSIYKNGVGILELGTDYTLVSGGGFALVSGQFTTDEVYYIWS